MRTKAFSVLLLLLFLFGIAILAAELFFKPASPIVQGSNEIKAREHFDPSLSRIRSIKEFTEYCDSLYGHKQIAAGDSEQYAIAISRTLRDRFYHGYSYYSLGQNSLGRILAPYLKPDLSAIVIPDDILKHPMAACSQQSIVGMEVFRKKGFDVRKVGFYADKVGGHFCFEVFFNDKWHFFDPDLEPKLSIMTANHFPGIAEIVKNDSLLQSLYRNQDDKLLQTLFAKYRYGNINDFPAPRAIIYQYVTKVLSYTFWLIPLLTYIFIFIRRRANSKEKCAELQGSLVYAIRA